MKKQKKWLLCFVLAVALLSGCGEKQEAATISPTAAPVAAPSAVLPETLCGSWELDVPYTETANGLSLRDMFGTALGQYGSGLILDADGHMEYRIGLLSAEGSWKADGDTGRYLAEVLELPNEISMSLALYGFREGPESAPRVAMDYPDCILYWKAYEPVSEEVPASPLEDIVWHLELSAMGKEFRNMDDTRRDGLLSEYRELTEGYSLMARESTDGSAAYIVGLYNGEAADSPLNGMYSINTDGRGEQQLLYREADLETVERALMDNEIPDVGYLVENSYFSYFDQGSVFLIQPKDVEIYLDTTINRYLHTPNGPEYIRDAAARGIWLNNATGPCLCVYRICEPYGEIFENIPLTEEQVSAILSEERVMLTEGFGFTADLYAEEHSELFTENAPIPPTVLDLAVEYCDYRFNDPSAIRDDIAQARLDCDWLEEPLYAQEAALPRLREILAKAEKGYVGACGYGAKLTLTFAGGEKLTVFKGTDGCDTVVFGSYGGYFLGDEENTEFWTMFGLDPETKEPLSLHGQ